MKNLICIGILSLSFNVFAALPEKAMTPAEVANLPTFAFTTVPGLKWKSDIKGNFTIYSPRQLKSITVNRATLIHIHEALDVQNDERIQEGLNYVGNVLKAGLIAATVYPVESISYGRDANKMPNSKTQKLLKQSSADIDQSAANYRKIQDSLPQELQGENEDFKLALIELSNLVTQ